MVWGDVVSKLETLAWRFKVHYLVSLKLEGIERDDDQMMVSVFRLVKIENSRQFPEQLLTIVTL